MKMTSMDIKNREFKKVLRGYDVDDVDEFLEKVANDYEILYKENSTLREQVSSLDEKIQHYLKLEETIQNTLILAQDSAEKAKESAQQEAELIIKSANESAQKILDKANNDVIQINDDYEKLKQEFNKFRSKYRNFMNTQLDMFDDLEKDFLKGYNLGNPISEEDVEEKEVEFEIDDEEEIDIKKFEEQNSQEDLDTIKTFFVDE